MKIDGLTPKASKHFEGVKNLYWQELEILKHNIMQCQIQDKRLQPTIDQKERRLWHSFSQSPSPERGYQREIIEESPIVDEAINEEYY